MGTLRIAIGTMASTEELLLSIKEDGTLIYLVGPISFSDLEINATIEQWNEYLCDNLVDDGHVLQDMTYALKAIDAEVFIEVNADAREWAEEIAIRGKDEDD